MYRLAELSKDVYKLLEENPKKALKNSLSSLLQEKMLLFLLEKADLEETAEYKQVSPKKSSNLFSY